MPETKYPSSEQEIEWAAWVAERPECVRKVAERVTPFNMYRMKTTGQIVSLLSFGEEKDGRVTLTVLILGANNPQNLFPFDREVFGVDPDDIVFHAKVAA